MNEFDRRWKLAAAAAAPASPQDSAAPFGFATRVVATWKSQPAPSLNALWQRLAWRALGSVAAALAMILAVGATFTPQDDPLTPPIEDTVSELLWLPQ